ncbi:cyclic pyranopterin monophosphate synthase MoaC [soil metagenome]
MVDELTHIDADGRARMVDVSDKAVTAREAVAEGRLLMQSATLTLAMSGGGKKGDVRAVAEIAGVMAAKRTADLIPMCHPLMLSSVVVSVEPLADETGLGVVARVRTMGQTGVEMEALTAASVALLTLYDMLKAVDRDMTIATVRLMEKSGGASGDWTRPGGTGA